MSNIIDSIQLSGTVYTIQGSGGGGGNPTVELTQAEYDALVSAGTVSANTYYIITDATAGDLTQYWTSAQTQSAITQATSGKVDTSSVVTAVTSGSTDSEIPTAKAVYDAIPQGGGGKAIEAGRGISITTGETADTVSFNLPISAGTGTNSIKCGENTQANGTDSFAFGANGVKANGQCSFAGGSYSEAKGFSSMAFGRYNTTNNYGEVALGFFNKSNGSSSAAGNSSGNTLFSVGNGTNTTSNTRHNAFEIRQNGDIYLTKDGQDVKLQDHLGGGSSYTAGDGIDITNDVISVTGKVDTTTYNTYTAATDTALGGKQATLQSGTNIKTINNESLLGSGNLDIQGGSTYTASSGITIDSNNVIGLDGHFKIVSNNEAQIPSAIGDYIHIGYAGVNIGYNNAAKGQYSLAVGYDNKVGDSLYHGEASMAVGSVNTTLNYCEFASGRYNNSVSGSSTFGDSGNTLFSVGNGTAENARHNAFEIRQNGDIYLTKDGQDVKLQDHLGGGGGSSYTAGDGIDITNDVISVTGKVDTTTYNTYTSATDTALASKADTATTYTKTEVDTALGGYVTTNTRQEITGNKTFIGSSSTSEKPIIFKQVNDNHKIGFVCRNTASTNNEVASFEFRPNTFTIDNVHHPLLYFGHYRTTSIANAGVPQTVIGFRQYDQKNAAAYHYLMPLPEKAKTPFSLTTSFKDYYAPMGFKNGSTMITADNTGVVDLSSELGGLKLKKLTQAEYDALATKDSNVLYVIVG